MYEKSDHNRFKAISSKEKIANRLKPQQQSISRSCLRGWSLAFEDEAQEQEYVAYQFEKSYFIVTAACKVAIVLSVLLYPIIGVYAWSPFVCATGLLGLRVHTHHHVARENKANRFCFEVVVINVLMHAYYFLVESALFPLQDAPPIIFAIDMFLIAMIVIFGKLACFPERPRQGITLLILCVALASPTYSTLDSTLEKILIFFVLIMAEFAAYRIEHQRRSMYRKVHREEAQIKLTVPSRFRFGSEWHRAILRSCLRGWSLAFEDGAQEQEYVAYQFEKSYFIVTAACKVAIVLSVLLYPIIGVYAWSPFAYATGLLGLRVHTHHHVAREGKANRFCFEVVVMTVMLNVYYFLVESGLSPPIVFNVDMFFIATVVIFCKLACLPECPRLGITILMLARAIATASYSTLGSTLTTITIICVLIIAEFTAYIIEHQRRSTYQKTDGLRQKMHLKDAQLKLLMETTLSAACIADQQMQIQEINSAMALMFGYAKDELVGKHVGILMMPSMAKRHHEFVQQFRRTGVSSILGTMGREVRGRHKDGHMLHLRLTLNLTHDRTRFAASFLDLAAEKARLELERNMKLILKTTQSPLAMADSKMKLTYVNQAVCNIFGYTEDELIGQSIGIIMDEATRAEHHTAVKAFQQTGKRSAIAILGREIQGKHKDGHALHFRLSLNLADDGELFVASLHDMSAEIARRESERKLKHYEILRSIYAEMPGAIAYEVCNPGLNQTIKWVAGATESFLGYSHDEWKTIHPLDTVITDASKPLAKEAITAMRKGESVPMVELEGTHRDGREVWLTIDKASRRLSSNNELIVLHDVTTEVRLRQANAIVATFQKIPGVILVTTDTELHLDIDGDVIGVTGYTANEFLELNPTCDFLSPDFDRAEVTSMFTTVIDPNLSFVEVNIPHVHKQGHTIWLRACHGTRVIGTAANGNPKVLVVFSDVTATLVAQRKTQAMHDALARRMKFVPAMVYESVAKDPKETRDFEYTNPESIKIFGLTPDEMTSSRKWMRMLHPEDVKRFEASIAQSQADMEKWDHDFRVVVGSMTKYIHGRATPRREGNRVVWTGVLQDVTVIHKLREMTKNHDIEKRLAQRLQAACAFLSHEIRNQLYPQGVILREIKDEVPKWSDYIDTILDANTTVNAILNRVLDLAKWESGDFPVNISDFLITQLFKSIKTYAEANGATVEGLESIQPTWHVEADEQLLKQAAINLVSNASKFSDDRAFVVSVAFEQTNDKEGVIVVIVTDKGRGMTPDQLTKVMVPFGRLRKAGDTQSGTGLGLALTKVMIESGHKGTLMLVSEGLDKGTTATMRVPVLWEDRREESRLVSVDPLWWVAPHPGVTADVLVVDDVKMNRMIVLFAARKLGLTCHQATDGTEAVELLRTNTYSMVFMDRQMPEMNGDIATEQARANGYTLPIVMVSGDTFNATQEEELRRRGITECMNKMAVPGTRDALKKLKELKNNSNSKMIK